MSEITINDVKTEIVNSIGLNTTEAAFVLNYLLEGYRDIINKLHPLMGTLSVSLIAGTQDYTLSATMEAVENVTIIGSLVRPERVTRQEILDLRRYANSGTTSGDVYCYCLEGQSLMIYPLPTSATTFTIYGQIAATTNPAFAGTETLVTDLGLVPLGPLHKCLLYYGLFRAAEYDDKTVSERSLDYLSQYNAFLIEAKKAVRRHNDRGLNPAQIGYPNRRGWPQRNDVYPSVFRYGR